MVREFDLRDFVVVIWGAGEGADIGNIRARRGMRDEITYDVRIEDGSSRILYDVRPERLVLWDPTDPKCILTYLDPARHGRVAQG